MVKCRHCLFGRTECPSHDEYMVVGNRFAQTSSYGHFGRKAGSDACFSWEKTDLAKAFQDAVAA